MNDYVKTRRDYLEQTVEKHRERSSYVDDPVLVDAIEAFLAAIDDENTAHDVEAFEGKVLEDRIIETVSAFQMGVLGQLMPARTMARLGSRASGGGSLADGFDAIEENLRDAENQVGFLGRDIREILNRGEI